ncbi:uncharacterized protein N7496_001252 [Penicillium cataractarum]|uniref:C2H2-type domain-containing protein n=1 Tax=Penicillium cataractarum TaxID=2100454 RepID=A0A9X0B6N9_9EURO|nr:uncharacterized protein N7496_001252 [Penicillium cataractarum]KAJ5390184.1 hypothetical protein N7496_001252 [Penicillium cataractarum]
MDDDTDWTFWDGTGPTEDVKMEDDQTDVAWNENPFTMPEFPAPPTIYPPPTVYPIPSWAASTISTNSNPSVFSGSTRSSGSSNSRLSRRYRPSPMSSGPASLVFDASHDNKRRVLPQQPGVPERESQHAANRARILRDLALHLESVGTDLQNGQTVLPNQLFILRNRLKDAMSHVEDLISQTSNPQSLVQPTPEAAPEAAHEAFADTLPTFNQSEEYWCCFCEKNGLTAARFKRRQLFKRHLIRCHFPSHEYHCPEIGCGRIYRRRHELVGHFRVEHNRSLQQEELDKVTFPLICPPLCGICFTMVRGWERLYQCVTNHCLVSPSNTGHDSSQMTSLKEDKNEPPPETSERHGTDINPSGAMEPISEWLADDEFYSWLPLPSPPDDGEAQEPLPFSLAFLGAGAHINQTEIQQSLPENLMEDTQRDLSTTPPVPLRKDSSSQPPKQYVPKPPEHESQVSTPVDKSGKFNFTSLPKTTPTPASQPGPDLAQRMQVHEPAPRVLVGSNTSKSSQTSDDEESHSMQTNITRPDQEDVFDLDTGIADNEDMEHILNPGAYYRKLDLLERRTAEICGIKRPEVQPKSQLKCRDSLKKSRDALRNLMEEGFCNNAMSILVKDQSRPNVARAVRVSLDDINDVLEGKRIFYSLDESGKIITLREWPKLQQLLGNLPLGRPPSESTWAYLNYLQFLADALSIGLVSFSGSHVCRFDENLWGKEKSEISIGNGYSFALRDLACLKDFLGGPAWVLGKEQTDVPTTGLKVSLTVEDLQQLWGPVWFMGGLGDEGVFIRTEAGYIIPLPRHMQTDQSLEEIECHWTSSYTGYETESPILLRSSSRILIGTEPCTATGLNINEGCPAPFNFLQARILPQLQPSGAHNAYHTLDGWDLTMQATLGSYVQAGGALKWKRNPARKWKTSIIEKCKYGKPNLRSLLSSHIGLEVSACTGNAHRVTLWDALRLSQTIAKRDQEESPQHEDPPPCLHRIADPDCIKSCWTRLFSTDDIDSSVNIPPEGDPKRKEYLRRIIMNAIIALEDTGVDHDSNLQAYWPFTENARTHRIELSPSSGEINNWIRVIKDSRDVATFAVASQRCMEVHHGQKRTCTMPCQVGNFTRPKTTLYTRILLNPPFQSTCMENHDCHMKDSSMGNGVDKLVPNEHFVLGEAALTVQSIFSGTENVIIATASGSAVKNGWMKLVKLNRRKMFQEDLDLDLSTGYYSPLLIH